LKLEKAEWEFEVTTVSQDQLAQRIVKADNDHFLSLAEHFIEQIQF